MPKELISYRTILFSCEALAVSDDKTLLQLMEFVEAGGRLIITANAYFRQTAPQANRLLEGFGLEIEDRDWPDRECIVDRIAENRYTTGVTKLKFFRPSLIRLTEAGKGSVLVPAPPKEGVDTSEAGFVVVAPSGNGGEVIVLGQSLWWHWLGQNANGGDAKRLLANVLQRE